MKEIENLNPRPFTKWCMSIGAVPASYLAGMTIEEQLLWLCSYLEKEVIPTVNNNGEAVTELQNLYEELHDYVEHYFDNLDVQEEINNKLDEMVEEGTLQEIIADYLNSKAVFGFDNVASMVSATNLIDGSYARTLGYYSVNDKGGALYKIRDMINTDVVDGREIIALNNAQLVAELISSVIYPEMYGAKGDGVTDDTTPLTAVFNSEKEVYLLNTYKITNISISGKNLDIKGSGKILGQSLLFYQCKGKIEINAESNGTENFVTYDECDNLTIRGTYKNAPRNSVIVSDCNNVDVSVSIYNAGLSGLILTGYDKNPKGANIHDCYIENSGLISGYNNAIYVNSNAVLYYYEQVNISNCVCKNCGCGGIFISADYSNISNCCVDTTGLVTPQTAIGIRVHDCQHVNVTNCEIKNSERDGIQTNKAAYINISNCICKNCVNCGFQTLYDATESGRYYGVEANKNVSFNSCMALDCGLYGNNTYPGFNITTVSNVSMINCMVNCTGEVKAKCGVMGNNPTNLVIVGCIFTNTHSLGGTTAIPSVGYWIDGNGPHFNMGGTYKSSQASFGISSERVTSINAASSLESVIKFISSFVDYMKGFGFFTTTSS